MNVLDLQTLASKIFEGKRARKVNSIKTAPSRRRAATISCRFLLTGAAFPLVGADGAFMAPVTWLGHQLRGPRWLDQLAIELLPTALRLGVKITDIAVLKNLERCIDPVLEIVGGGILRVKPIRSHKIRYKDILATREGDGVSKLVILAARSHT